jgi:hypothetical protein
MMFVASAAALRSDDQEFEDVGLDGFSNSKVALWVKATIAAFVAKFGKIACWRLDRDEKTPHLSIFFAPIIEKKLKSGRIVRDVSVRKAFGGSKLETSGKLSDLQTWYAAEMQVRCPDLKLERGRPKSETGLTNLSPRAMRELEAAKDVVARELEQVLLYRAEAEALHEQARQREVCSWVKRRCTQLALTGIITGIEHQDGHDVVIFADDASKVASWPKISEFAVEVLPELKRFFDRVEAFRAEGLELHESRFAAWDHRRQEMQ